MQDDLNQTPISDLGVEQTCGGLPPSVSSLCLRGFWSSAVHLVDI